MSNAVVTVVSAISLAFLVAILISFIWQFCKLERKDKYKFLKKFKKGKCVLVYFAAIPLYLVASIYAGNSFGVGLLHAVAKSVELVVLKIDVGLLSPLMGGNILFAVSVYVCYAMVVINSLVFIFTLFGMGLVNKYYLGKAVKQKEKIYVVVGYNQNNCDIVKSIVAKGESAVLFCDKTLRQTVSTVSNKGGNTVIVDSGNKEITEEIKTFAFCNGIGFKHCNISTFKKVLDGCVGKYLEEKAVNVIINTESDEQNLLIVKELADYIVEKHSVINRDINRRNGINGYVYCQPENTSSFTRFAEHTKGCIQYVNKYKLIAMGFSQNYPLTKFNRDALDENLPILKPNAELNVVMIGFGKLGKEMFKTMVSTEQFITLDGQKIVEKPVHYYIYDDHASVEEKNHNHNYARYSIFLKDLLKTEEKYKERKLQAEEDGAEFTETNPLDDYLPLPQLPADRRFISMSVDEEAFYNSIKKNISSPNNYSYIIVSFGTDLENLDMAGKLSDKIREWGLRDRVSLFVKIRKGEIACKLDTVIQPVVGEDNNATGYVYPDKKDIMIFGNENQAVYNIDKIVAEKVEALARFRHLCYNAEYCGKATPKAVLEKARETWYKENSQVQRESNLFASLSIRTKLNMMGFDYVEDKENFDGEHSTQDMQIANEFMEKYQRGDKIVYEEGKEVEGRKKVILKNSDFERFSLRKIMAVLEHQRWNATHVAWGFIPAEKKVIQVDKNNGKDFSIRRHGCLTTFEGLVTLREIITERKLKEIDAERLEKGMPVLEGKEREEQRAKLLESTDVIRYDYQIMDDLVWLLNKSKFKIVKLSEKI